MNGGAMPVKDTIEAIRMLPFQEQIYLRTASNAWNGCTCEAYQVDTQDLKALVTQYERMEQALRYYQDRDNWKQNHDGTDDFALWCQHGNGYDIARKALGKDIEPAKETDGK